MLLMIASPALFTSTSTGPNARSTATIMVVTAALSDTSAATDIALPPAFLMTATTSSASAARSR